MKPKAGSWFSGRSAVIGIPYLWLLAFFLLPFLIVGVVVLHLVALHRFGSNNPLGIDTKGPQDTIPFHPYYTVKDAFGLGVFLIFYTLIVFFAPNMFGEPDNYIPANPLATPPHIVPEWYYLPFYAILRAIPNKLLGVAAMFGAIVVGVATLALGLALVVRINEAYGTIEEDEIFERDRET